MPRLENRDQMYKRPFDLTILITTHVCPILLPIWVLLWISIPFVIWLEDRGPIFYRQKRVGKDGRIFTIAKFRTMVRDADRLGPVWTTDSDPRVTRTGRFLRRTALDELPELLSIWKGDMSFVGPRALAVEEQKWMEDKFKNFSDRLVVRPGLTGLARIYNSNDDPATKIQYDLEYVKRASPLLDLGLLIRSVWNTLTAAWDKRANKPTYRSADFPESDESQTGS